MDPTGPGFATPAGFTHPFYLNGIYIGGENGFRTDWSTTIGRLSSLVRDSRMT